MNHYSMEELIELGCPPGLTLQYLNFTKEEINSLIYTTSITHLITEME